MRGGLLFLSTPAQTGVLFVVAGAEQRLNVLCITNPEPFYQARPAFRPKNPGNNQKIINLI
jgi:hypothetical protein